MKFRIKNKTALAAMVAVTVLGMGAAGTLAYLTDSEQHVNTFTTGDVKTELEEPHWDPENAKNLVPSQTAPKDPQIENSGDNDEIVFMKVTVPLEDVTLVQENGMKGAKSVQEIVYLQKSGTAAGVYANAFNTGTNGAWVELTGKEGSTANTKTYVFAYDKKLAKNEKTPTLFDQIKLKNVVEKELTANSGYDIKIEAYAIQADNIMKNGEKLTTDGVISPENLAYIYDTYTNQAQGDTARDATGGEKNLSGN